MITFKKTLLTATVAATLALTQFGTAQAQELLRVSTPIPASHPLMTEVIKPWAARVGEVTEGRVDVRVLPKLVGSFASQFDVAMTGQADISMGNQAYNPGRFTQYAFVELPGNGDRAVATSVAFWNTYQQFFADTDELSDVKVLTLFTSGPGQLFTTEHIVESMDGNAGVKVRGGGEASTRVVETLGMSSIQAPFSKAAEMISNGIVDGAMLDRSLVPVFGFDRYFNNRFSVKGGLYNVSYFFVMNKDAWNRISEEDQAAIDAISGATLAAEMGEVWDALGDAADIGFEESGMVTTIASGDLETSLNTAFAQYEQDWIDVIAAEGVDGRAVIDAYRASVKELEGQ